MSDVKITFNEQPFVLRLYQGLPGKNGLNGDAATVQVGTVTTVSPSTPAAVRNRGTTNAAVLDFDIPKGDPGDASSVPWGNVTGTLADQTDLKGALDAKADAADLGTISAADYTISSTDLTDGTSPLPTGDLYFYYEA